MTTCREAPFSSFSFLYVVTSILFLIYRVTRKAALQNDNTKTITVELITEH